ncbi:MAG: nuclear transport factor 2 family protein [Nitrososphaerales archaeon]
MVKDRGKERSGNEDVVLEYFRLMANKDIDNLLELFADDAVIYEPFSKTGGLVGKDMIEPFLRVAMMANEGLQRTIVIEKDQYSGKVMTALVTFEGGERVKGRFTFDFDAGKSLNGKDVKIKALHIQFI